MVFSSEIFVFYFLPLVLLLYYVLPGRGNTLLLLASYAFYGWTQPWFILLMFAATVVNYVCGGIIAGSDDNRARARRALVVAAVVSLGLLGFFKYFMFATENLNRVLAAFGEGGLTFYKITLPIGISFYIFQSLSYPIDVYRGTSPPVRSFWDFACYIALFPQLIAGPIVRYNTIADQLVDRSHTLEKFSAGAGLFILGFAKKVLLADPMGRLADSAFGVEQPLALDAWFGVTAYALQIYFDFAGYSDMAVGLGRMFGFEFLKNFDAPYRADSITDFWRRWHISLSTFLRDYLYIPLGGNRVSAVRNYINLTIVMLLGGLWHGANWTFVVWGAFHGLLLASERMMGKRSLYGGLPRPLRVGITFVLVLISWVFFRAETLSGAMSYLAAMFGLGDRTGPGFLLAAQFYHPGVLIGFGLCVVLAFMRTQAMDWIGRITLVRAVGLLVLFLVTLATMFTQAFSPFLYFQF